MTLTTPYSATFIVGDGETKTFSYLFEEVSPNFISVMVYNSLTGLISTPTYVIDTDQKQVIFGEDTPAPSADETVCIYRNTPNVQDVAFRTLHGYDAQTLENILSKIVAMIQEIKSNYFSTQVLQGDPWQLDLLSSADDGATVNIDYTAKKLVKGLYFKITSGNLQVSADGTNYITMPKSDDVAEFRQYKQTLPDLKVIRKLQYRVGNTWYNTESNAESTANKALQVAEEARDIANDAKDIAQDTSDKVDTFDARLTIAEQDSSDAKELAQEASESVGQFDARITQAEQNANQAKTIATNASTAVNNHITNYNNPHQVTKAQVGLGNVDNTSDLNKPVSTATQNALDDITDLIPAQATTTNQLADKGFVNSSIATNTANFIGTFNSVAELEAYSGTVTNNDYAFVVGTDSAGNTTYNRYKYNGNTQQWVYEYTLNNSSFTAAQWASINSGVTTSDVLKARSAVQPSDLGNGTITITQGGEPKGSFTTNQATPTTIELDQGGSGSGHNVGDTFLTTRTDNELNGAVECNGATYNTTDFTGAQSIGTLLAAGKVPYVSLATYATLLSTQGYCDRFGWDGVGTTAFRIPTLDLHHAVIEVLEPTSTNPYWYRRYADGWVEQGGIYVASANAANAFVPFPLSMADTNYTLTTTYTQPTAWQSNTGNTALNVTCRLAASTNRKLTNGFYFNSVGVDGVYSWRVSGKASVGSETLYQRAMVQLAVSATDEALETCTGVLANVAANTAAIAGADYVIESQLPTAANNYTWYRKYKSGWVEQGGCYSKNIGTGDTAWSVSLPVPMSDNNYTASVNVNGGNSGNITIQCEGNTSTVVKGYGRSPSGAGSKKIMWRVEGMAA